VANRRIGDGVAITFDAALDAYRHGVGSITDTTRAATALLEAQNASTDAYSAAPHSLWRPVQSAIARIKLAPARRPLALSIGTL